MNKSDIQLSSGFPFILQYNYPVQGPRARRLEDFLDGSRTDKCRIYLWRMRFVGWTGL